MKTTLHSLSFCSSGTHAVFFLLGEEGEIMLSQSSSARSAFVLLHTPDEYIVFGNERITISFGGVRTEIPSPGHSSIKLVKNGSRLAFLNAEGGKILSIEKDAFQSSASFGLAIPEGR